MGFVFLTLGMLALIIGVLLVIGHYYQGSSAELVDWKPTRSPEVEAQNEIDDLQQMLAAQPVQAEASSLRQMDHGWEDRATDLMSLQTSTLRSVKVDALEDYVRETARLLDRLADRGERAAGRGIGAA